MSLSKQYALVKNNNGMLVFGKKGCHYCDKLINELNLYRIPFEYKCFDPDDKSYTEDAKELKLLSNMTTFPMIYLKSLCIGGYNDFMSIVLKPDILENMLLSIGIKIDNSF